MSRYRGQHRQGWAVIAGKDAVDANVVEIGSALWVRGDLKSLDGRRDPKLGLAVQAQTLRTTERPPAVVIHLALLAAAQVLNLIRAQVLPGEWKGLQLFFAE